MFTITINEIIDVIAMSIASGYIFIDAFPSYEYDQPFYKRLNYSILLVSIPIILHELGHKIVASIFGLKAVFHAAYGFLFLGVILKLIKFPLIILVPAYVQITGSAPGWVMSLTAFAGPAVHLILYLASLLILLHNNNLSEKQFLFLKYFKFINGFLFVFNMLPIPGFDGYQIIRNLFF